MRARRVAHTIAICFCITLPVAEGCGGNDAAVSGSGADDGGSTDDGSTGGGDDSSTGGDASSGGDSSAASSFCAAEQSYATRCSLTDKCTTERVANCASDESNLNPQYVGAVVACEPIEPCGPGPSADGGGGGGGDGGVKAYNDCFKTHFGDPDTAAKDLAAGYCATCLPHVGGCAGNFYAAPQAQRLLAFDDAILNEIAATCTHPDGGADDAGAGAACSDAFTKCAKGVVDAHDPPPPDCPQ